MDLIYSSDTKYLFIIGNHDNRNDASQVVEEPVSCLVSGSEKQQ